MTAAPSTPPPLPEPAAAAVAHGFHSVKPCRYGAMIYNRHDAYIGRSLDLYGEYSEGEVEVFRHILAEGDVAVDAGANIGAHTVAMARIVGSAGRVLAFEPQRVLFQALCGNAAINSLTNIDARHAALGAGAGVVRLPPVDYARPANFGGITLVDDQSGDEVAPVLTIDSLQLARCRLLKIDVEGMESDVLRGAVGTIERCRPLLYLEDDRPDRSAALHALLQSLRYAAWRHRPPYYSPNNFAGESENAFPNVVSDNLLCVPREMPFAVDGLPRVNGGR